MRSFEKFFLVLMIIIFALIILNIFLSYKEYKQIKQFKDTKQLLKEEFIKCTNFMFYENEGFIREIDSYIDDNGNEVLYVYTNNKRCVLNTNLKINRKLKKGDDIYIHNTNGVVWNNSMLPSFSIYIGFVFNDMKVFEKIREIEYSVFFVEDEKERLINELNESLYKEYCDYYKYLYKYANGTFRSFFISSLTRDFR